MRHIFNSALALVALVIAGGAFSSLAGNVVQRTGDAINTSSFTGSTNWNPAGIPANGNDYSTSFGLRTPNDTAAYMFAGDSLTLNAGAALGFKGSNVMTVSNLRLNGGKIQQSSNGKTPDWARLAGGIILLADSTLEALNAARILEIQSPITGEFGLAVQSSATPGGVVLLSTANPAFTGKLTITNNGNLALGAGGFIDGVTNISIAAGCNLDVSARTSPYNLSASMTLTAAGGGTAVGVDAATIKGTAGGIINFASQRIILNCDGANPALYISQGSLALNGNAFTVNKSSVLLPGTYVLIQQAAGNIVSSGPLTVTGTALNPAYANKISVNGDKVLLTVGGPASASKSTVTASPTSVSADGITAALVTVSLKDAAGTPLVGKTVTLASSRGATDTISATSGISSSSGGVSFVVTSSTAGSAVFTATDATDGVTITGTATVTFAAVDQYNVLRLKWANYLIGSTNATELAGYATTANGYWTTLNTNASRTYLWSDYPFGVTDQSIWGSYARLQAMALAWAAPGCSLYGNTALRLAITNALDWMNANVYTPTSTRTYGDWYGWEIRAPQNLNNTAVLMYPALTGSQITNYNKAVDQFNPDSANATYGWMTGANLTGQSQVMMIRGILGRNSAKMTLAQTKLSGVFPYVTSDDGFYRDGSFIQHHDIAYNGAYGYGCLGGVSSLVNLLFGSTWAITDPNLTNVYAWVTNSFMPLIYGGAMMDMVRGRIISMSSYKPDYVEGATCLGYIQQVAQFAPPALATSISNFVNAQYPRLSSGQFLFAGMDRVVALRPGFGLGLSMSSSRIATYESINGDNKRGWFTGDGMTYLYLGSVDRQFASDFWCTVDQYHLPGTTVDQTPRADVSGQGAKTGEKWVGGAQVAGTYGVAGMSLNAWGSSLVAKKSWFMFDEEIVCLGAGITCSGTNAIHTTVENRRIGTSTTKNFTANGTVYPPTMGWSSSLSGVSWCALDGVGGYYFPGGANVSAAFETRTGRWSDIGNSSTTLQTDGYLRLWFNHGMGPSNSKYAYVLLPNLNAASVSNYAANPDIVVLRNGTDCQAVSKTSAGIVAANFWVDGVNAADFISVNAKASIIAWTNETGIAVGISDPTQTNSGAILVVLNWTAHDVKIQTADAGVTVLQFTPTIILSVNVNGAKGKTFNASFTGTNEVTINSAPVLAAISNRVIVAGATLAVTNQAADSNSPPQLLSFGLATAPPNATINASNGFVSWRPAIAQSGTSHQFTVVVTNSSLLSATQSFWATVTAPAEPTLNAPGFSGGRLQLLVSGDYGPDYVLEATTNMINWTPLFTSNSPALPFLWSEPVSNGIPQRFYRLRLGP